MNFTFPAGGVPWIKDRTVFLVKHGSQSYGTNVATSDLDVKGIAIPPIQYFLGHISKFEQQEFHNPDIVVYDIRKFFKLASDCNPNIIEVLFTDPSDYLFVNEVGQRMVDFKHLFLSKKARHTFSGYAHAQLHRMKNHHEWMVNPPQAVKSRFELGLPQSKNWCDYIDARPGKTIGISDQELEMYQLEHQWREQSKKWANYQEWLKGRNPDRHNLEAKYGYDTKHAMHLVRLMRMCEEILTKGTVIVKRPDREELLAIRNGAWAYEQLLEWAEDKENEMDELYKQSTLPHGPDNVKIEQLCIQLVEEYM